MCIVKKAPWSEVYRQHLLVGQPDPAGEISFLSDPSFSNFLLFFPTMYTE
jgi:hypothetical protein